MNHPIWVNSEELEEAVRAGGGSPTLDVDEATAVIWRRRDGGIRRRRQHPGWVMITPHIANPDAWDMSELRALVEDNVRRFVNGQPLLGVVDLDLGY